MIKGHMQITAFFMAILLGAPAVAEDWISPRDNLCRGEHPGNISDQKICSEEWNRSMSLVFRYKRTFVDNVGFWEAFKDGMVFNPYRVNRPKIFSNCHAGEAFNGNAFNNRIDFRSVWRCIAAADKEVALWDTI